MVDLLAEAARLDKILQSLGWRFCFIGGLAVQHWGEPRLTRDLDVSLLTGFGDEASYVDSLLRTYSPRVPSARDFALARRVLLLISDGGIGIDISLAALPYEELAIDRSIAVEMLPGLVVRLCSAEDLIVMKMFSGRDTDLRDLRSVIVRQQQGLDWGYVEANLAELAELSDDPTLVARLGDIRESVARD